MPLHACEIVCLNICCRNERTRTRTERTNEFVRVRGNMKETRTRNFCKILNTNTDFTWNIEHLRTRTRVSLKISNTAKTNEHEYACSFIPGFESSISYYFEIHFRRSQRFMGVEREPEWALHEMVLAMNTGNFKSCTASSFSECTILTAKGYKVHRVQTKNIC